MKGIKALCGSKITIGSFFFSLDYVFFNNRFSER